MKRVSLILGLTVFIGFATLDAQGLSDIQVFAGGSAQVAAESAVVAAGRAFAARFAQDSLLAAPVIIDTVFCDADWLPCGAVPVADRRALVRAFSVGSGGVVVRPPGESRRVYLYVDAPYRRPPADTVIVSVHTVSPSLRVTGALRIDYLLLPQDGVWTVVAAREFAPGYPSSAPRP